MKSKPWMQAALIATCLSAFPLSVSALPESQQQGPVSFVSGGIGENEAQEIKSIASQYPLQLLFVTKGAGEYLADVKVQIKDVNGKVVLDTTSAGPYLLAKLTPGRYTVNAELNGTMKRQTVQVSGNKTQRVVLAWDDKAA